MKLQNITRMSVAVCLMLLCIGYGVYSFWSLSVVEKRHDFNLYSLVPQDAIAVFETDKVATLVDDINQLHCSRDNHFLYVSELFVYLKNYLHTLVDDTPHGLSRQMNKMLISFHEPDTPLNQVLYFSLGTGDYELVESFVRKYSASAFPAKKFDYKGEEIRIYSLENGSFLSAYMTPDFLVLSFQKRLIEEVIDAHHNKKALSNLSSFAKMYDEMQGDVAATVYLRMKEVDMGSPTDDVRAQSNLGSWAEFDLALHEDAIYCSGISHSTSDSLQTFIDALLMQQPIEGFVGEKLPATTFFYNSCAISDRASMLGFMARQEYAKDNYPADIKQRDEKLLAFLNECASDYLYSCLFHAKDTSDVAPCAVLNIPLKDEVQAERRLQNLFPRTVSGCYVLPRNTVLTQITGITESAVHTYAAFCQGSLLLAPDVRSLNDYVEALEGGEVLSGHPFYEEATAGLSPHYHFMMLFDMETILHQPENYVRLIPKFFFRHAKFFRHFVLAIQFTCSEQVVYPNIVLLYKGEEVA
ncbi:MAG: DUF3352 domain-containing protein [Bacteroides sp.]|nr:DUF3352 domain-containing protein [Bacteroides sp.]